MINVTIGEDKKIDCEEIFVRFGSCHAVRIIEKNGKTKFMIVSTHHGINADATKVPSELEKFINEIRAKHPNNGIDSI